MVATDPDADRLGVEIRQPDGSYLNLSGNQIGAIIAKYILEAHKTAGTLPANAALCKSIVSTELVTKIAESYGATMFNVLTGFKFIGEKIHEFETQHNHTYMLGFEESFGYLIKPFVRDKDAIQAVLIVAEIAAYYRSRGMTLADGIEEIYKNTATSQKKPSLLPFQVWMELLKSRKSWINSVVMLLNNSTTQTLLRQKTSWNKQLLLLTALRN